MRRILIIFMVLVLLLVVGCSTKDAGTTSTETQQSVGEPEMQTGLLTKTFTHKDENISETVIINTLDKSGSVEMEYYVSDKDESNYQINGLVSGWVCSTFWNLYRDYDTGSEEIKAWTEELQKDMNITITLSNEDKKEQVRQDDFFKGFKATTFSLKFIDKEDGTTISECYNTGTGENDLTYKGYDTTTAREEKLAEDAFNQQLDSYNEATVTETVTKAEIECPKMTKGSSFSFDYNKDYDILRLSADFLINAKFSDGWELNYEPYEDYLSCEKGSVAGENINNLYCTPSSSYYSTLKKNTIDDDGNIVQTDYLSMKSFIFDAKGKDTTRVDDLKSLQFENMTCSESYY